MDREAKGRELPSSAKQHFTRCLHDLTLDLFTRFGPFWKAVDEFRGKWDIDPVTKLPTESDWTSLPSVGPEASDLTIDSEDSEPHGPSRAPERWQEELRSLLQHLLTNGIVPPPCVIPGPFDRSLRHWSPFLAACAQYDPPEMELLAFADEFVPLPETFEEAVGLGTCSGTREFGVSPSMVLPPITLDDADVIEAQQQWFLDRLIDELDRRLTSIGIDVRELCSEVLRDPSFQKDLRSRRFNPDPYKANIVVTPETTEDDVRSARTMIHDWFAMGPRTGRPGIDELTAVQVAIFRRNRWKKSRIALRFGWKLAEDTSGKRRRSDTVDDYIELGEQILRDRENPRD